MSMFHEDHGTPVPNPPKWMDLRQGGPSRSPEDRVFEAQLDIATESGGRSFDKPASAEAPMQAVAAAQPLTSTRVNMLGSRPVQLTIGLLLGGLLPALFPWPSERADISLVEQLFTNPAVENSLLGSCVAIALAWVMLRKLVAHPYAKSVGYVPYIFGLTYGALAIVLFILRADYSRYELAASFLLATSWFAFVHWLSARPAGMRMGLVPSRNLAALPLSSKVRWIKLWEPNLEMAPIDGLVADFRADHSPEWKRLMARCALDAIPIYDLRYMREQLTGRLRISDFSEDSFASTMHDLVYAEFKRALDVLSVLVLLPVFLPVIGVAAFFVALGSPGPLLFRQVRMGYRGRPFTIYKLRTMQHGANGPAFTSPTDARVTRVGRFLRKYHIDEFPQIWNILKGEMSWIGPRPETLELSEWYEREVPYYCYRHIVRPGISGWAQVNQGNVGEIDAATEKLQLDFYYIKHLSPWLDMLITAKTVQAIRTGFGSI